ncbi:SDR family oxidoreductase [Hymenobacter sp. PAMC 26628]|uniref:SDR family oxidoreductase n=1 Tax=Hymenobacter sp. PAMC 26628 TaxID=1484118 RepID=UPI00077044F3|nr:SDR family NAD(P)-dependent oxidoreductase [Hymenobacter sp. PAMC 26628]AMJ66025.1 short-chain dehydrogenase [Hymenobacter sp. PAMC 26628]
MNLSNNTVLITGGASGIGLALAVRFQQAGGTVIVVGRRADKLAKAAQQHPGLHTHVADVATAADRVALAAWVMAEFPGLNVLVNNAGVQNRVSFADLAADWDSRRQEIAINLEAPLHLSALLAPHLGQQPGAAIVNVTSGLAFVPVAGLPIYCATKAAMHSVTLSLRQQLLPTGVQVVEIVLPAVDTDLGGPGLHTHGVPLDAFADAVMARVAAGELEVSYASSEKGRLASRAEAEAAFKQINNR